MGAGTRDGDDGLVSGVELARVARAADVAVLKTHTELFGGRPQPSAFIDTLSP